MKKAWQRVPFMRDLVGSEAQQEWPGGYVYNEAGQLVYVPRAVGEVEGYRLLKPAAPLRILGALCKPGDVLVDGGAGLGQWTLEAARLVGPQGRVLAVEPVPHVASALRKSLRANRLENVAVAELALAEAGGRRPFSVARDAPRGSRFGMVERDGGREFSPIAVRTARLDDLAREHALPRLDVLRIDVEGFEPDVLAGAGETLARFAPAILLECGSEDARRRQRSAELFERYRYEVVGVLRDEVVAEATLSDYASRRGAFAEAAVVNVLLMRSQEEER